MNGQGFQCLDLRPRPNSVENFTEHYLSPFYRDGGGGDIILRTQEVVRFVHLLNLDICRSFWNGEHDVSVVAPCKV